MINLFAIITLLLALTVPVAKESSALENLLINPGFEEVSELKPRGWKYDQWKKDRQAVQFYLTKDNTHSGRFAIAIDVSEEDDAKVMQTISVVPESIYSFSCWVRAEGIASNKKGANISVLGILETSEDVYDTRGQWSQIHFYGKTGWDQREIVFTLRLGGYGSLNKGRAYFDDCTVERLNATPEGAKIAALNTPERSSKGMDWGLQKHKHIIGLFIASVLFGGLVFIWSSYYLRDNCAGPSNFNKYFNKQGLVPILFIIGFLSKIILAYNSSGFPVDLMTYKAWADLLAKKGFADFYFSGHFVDYPPLYMYVLFLIGKLRYLLSIDFDSPLFVLLLKMPSLIAEFISALIIYRTAKAHNLPPVGIIIVLFAFIFNPALTINSSLWGQVDSVLALLVAISLLLLLQGKPVGASIAFTCAVLMKPQALMFTPLFILYFAHRGNLKEFIMSVGASLLLAIIIILPFSMSKGPIWLLKIFQNALVQYPYATLNAFNIYALIGKNWAPVASKLIIPLKLWGGLAIVCITLFSGFVYIRSKNYYKILLIALFISLSVFMFSTEMHERYMIPFFLLACIAYTIRPERRFLFIITIFAITNTFNIGYTLALAHQGTYHLNTDDLLLRFFSLCNLIGYLFFIKWFWFALFDKRQAEDIGVQGQILFSSDGNKEFFKPDLSLSRQDAMAVIALVIAFTCLYFYNLGSTLSPQTYWKPGIDGEAFYIDFGKAQDISRISYYAGIGTGRYRIDVSDDFIKWSTALVIDQRDIFQWKTKGTRIHSRYLSLVTEKSGGVLFEIGLFDSANKLLSSFQPKPFAVFQGTEGSIKHLFDEQQGVPLTPSYKNSMYFDEIYFARTAYEITRGMEPYENTHPPLGKLFMAASVKSFGMTPFGWRFAGTLSGILLITAMFFMGRLLFGSTKYGIFSALLTGLDFMPFVQARVATVDTFAVLFIVLMYYFMLRYYLASLGNRQGSLRCLALSGLSFGLGAATKWLCLYAGLGLAVLYFSAVHRRLKDQSFVVKANNNQEHPKKIKVNRQGDVYPNNHANSPKGVFRYFLYGVLCFALVPIIIYILSYVPFMMLPGQEHDLIAVLDYQINMFQYHKSIKGSHPFASTWWQWPIIAKPMWFYMGTELPEGKASSIVSMGNPLIWWAGLLSLIYMLVLGLRKRSYNLAACFIIIGFLSNYLPWIFVPREIYIYHFFASVPFLILGTLYVFRRFESINNKAQYIPLVYIALALMLFVLFYPILSGAVVDKEYMSRYLKWFDSWIFFLP